MRLTSKDIDKLSWDTEKLIAYDNASIAKQDARGRLIAAEKKGKLEGILESKLKGRLEVMKKVVELSLIHI